MQVDQAGISISNEVAIWNIKTVQARSRTHNMRRNLSIHPTRVHNQLGVLFDQSIVEAIMVGGDHHRVKGRLLDVNYLGRSASISLAG
ncbi:hypothetical protein CWI75_17975 [Kineobactrum sediminis]|uniref:Uncharacterized protein n=1 Tax=Kineobactrum sediminis TaxID=1905677 RepID=A0A2N5XY00_9GAMM|nr:hypothetical protein CWI75_17975 [Kineobactrum sediminis]